MNLKRKNLSVITAEPIKIMESLGLISYCIYQNIRRTWEIADVKIKGRIIFHGPFYSTFGICVPFLVLHLFCVKILVIHENVAICSL